MIPEAIWRLRKVSSKHMARWFPESNNRRAVKNINRFNQRLRKYGDAVRVQRQTFITTTAPGGTPMGIYELTFHAEETQIPQIVNRLGFTKVVDGRSGGPPGSTTYTMKPLAHAFSGAAGPGLWVYAKGDFANRGEQIPLSKAGRAMVECRMVVHFPHAQQEKVMSQVPSLTKADFRTLGSIHKIDLDEPT